MDFEKLENDLISRGDGVFSAAYWVGRARRFEIYKALQGATFWELLDTRTGRRTFHRSLREAFLDADAREATPS